MSDARWVVVVPVRSAGVGKSRLAAALPAPVRAVLVRAMATDTIEAAVAAPGVGLVVLVGGDRRLRSSLAGRPGVALVGDPGGGLAAAVTAGVAWARAARPGCPVAVLLGDLPALRADELDAALTAAAAHPRAFVPDAGGTGTTLLTARADTQPDPHFGPGSAAAHQAAGHVPLDLPARSGLRQDVDVPEDLDQVRALGLGACTAAALAARSA